MMATRKDKIRSNWRAGMKLFDAGKHAEGIRLAFHSKPDVLVADLKWLAEEANERMRIMDCVQSVINKVAAADDDDLTVEEIVRRAAKRGDQAAIDLLISDDLDIVF